MMMILMLILNLPVELKTKKSSVSFLKHFLYFPHVLIGFTNVHFITYIKQLQQFTVVPLVDVEIIMLLVT